MTIPMISFQRREDIAPSVLMVFSILVLAGTLAYMLLVPKPSAAQNTRAATSSRRRMVDDIAETRHQTRVARMAIQPRLWHGDPEFVTATALALLTRQTEKRSLKLTSFRPDRSQEFADVTELRFDVQVAGPYAGLHSLLAAQDARGSKLVLRSVQITASQAAGSTVTASLGLSAFVAGPALVSPAGSGGSHG
jgi:hypothetical protein